MPEAAYLQECYLKEDSLPAKRVLLWIFTRIGNKEEVLNILNALHEKAEAEEQKAITKTMNIIKEKP